MTELKLSAIPDDKPVKLTVALPAEVFRDLQAYSRILAGDTTPPDPAKLRLHWPTKSNSKYP